jgi:hypothetical protein
MNIQTWHSVLLSVAALVVGCSSSETKPDTGNVSSTQTDAGSEASSAADSADTGSDDGGVNCVPDGYAGNEKGVGAWCSATSPCASGKEAGTCTADFPQAGPNHFCTIAGCTTDGDCGNDAYCNKAAGIGACTPNICGGQDAG